MDFTKDKDWFLLINNSFDLRSEEAVEVSEELSKDAGMRTKLGVTDNSAKFTFQSLVFLFEIACSKLVPSESFESLISNLSGLLNLNVGVSNEVGKSESFLKDGG